MNKENSSDNSNSWWHRRNDKETGPLSLAEMRALVQTGYIRENDAVRQGETDWRPAKEYPLLYEQEAHGNEVPSDAEPITSGLAVAALVLAAGAVLLFPCTGGFSFILLFPTVLAGHIARYRIRKEPRLYKGNGFALAALVIAYGIFLLLGAFIGYVEYHPELKARLTTEFVSPPPKPD